MVTPLRQSCSSALWRLVLGRDMGCSSTHAGVGVPVRLCQMHRELHLTKRGLCGDRRNIIPFAHHHSRAFVLLLPARRGGKSKKNPRVEGTRASNHGEFSNNNEKKAVACSPMVFSCFKGVVFLFFKR